jgi:6-phosphogluconolactonase
MTQRDVRLFDDVDGLYAAAAELFAAAAESAVGSHGRFRVALAGGGTPLGLYERLAAPPWRDRVPWDRTHAFWGDERAVGPAHPDSNYGRAAEALLRHVPLPPRQVHRLRGERRDLDAAAGDYERLLRGHLGERPDGTPRSGFDLLLLGMGRDGHTASLFPGDEPLTETRRWVAAATAPPWVQPARRLTLTLPVLDAARRCVFLVTGEDKGAALRAVLDPPTGAPPLPAAHVRPRGPTTWLVWPPSAVALRP